MRSQSASIRKEMNGMHRVMNETMCRGTHDHVYWRIFTHTYNEISFGVSSQVYYEIRDRLLLELSEDITQNETN